MYNFVSDLYRHYLEIVDVPDNPKEQDAIIKLVGLRGKVRCDMGEEFLSKLQEAEYNVTRFKSEDAFLLGLRVGVQFLGTCWGISDPSPFLFYQEDEDDDSED